MTDRNRPLTPKEVGAVFSVSASTVSRWATEGRIPFFLTPSGHRRFRLEDVRAFVDGSKPAPEPEKAAS